MGGAHPTYNPSVIDDLELDVICQGDGDRAILAIIDRFEKGASFDGIPNLSTDSKARSAISEERQTADT